MTKMKKNVMTLASVLCCTLSMMVQTACTYEDNPAKPQIGKASITVETKALYDELGMTDRMTQLLAGGYALLTDTVLIYDQTGALVSKLGTESSSLQPLHFQLNALPNGTYTLVGWQSIRGKISGDRCWTVAGEEQLATLNISTTYQIINETWALGAVAATVTIDGDMIEATVAPKAMGSTIDIQVEGEAEYKNLYLYALKEWTYGCYMDPSRAEEDRWMVNTDRFYACAMAHLTTGKTEGKFFTLCHGDDMYMAMWDVANESKEIATSEHQKMHAGDHMKYYVHLDRTSYQPPFFAPIESFAAWKADRDAGILVFDPCLKFGCNIDEVKQHVSKKMYWRSFSDELRYWDAMAAWRKDYRIADNITEQYLFKGQNGEQLFYVYCFCPDFTLEMANNTLLKQGYVYNGKIKFPEYDLCDLFFSADGQVEVQTFVANGLTQIFYQPTDPDDFQYIVK